MKLKSNTQAILIKYVKARGFKQDDNIFPNSSVICNTLERLRTNLAKKLQDPELEKIRLYDLRHYYVSMLYYKTKDLVLTAQKLGHRNIKNTMVYVHPVSFNENDEFYSATAKTFEEATALIEQRFDYVTEMDTVKLFRKRK